MLTFYICQKWPGDDTAKIEGWELKYKTISEKERLHSNLVSAYVFPIQTAMFKVSLKKYFSEILTT